MEQTVYLGTTTTDVVVYTQAIDSSGSHVALVVNTSTSKLVFADGTVSSATPTVASLGTGKAKVTFASIANSSLSAGDTVAVRINGTADNVQFSEYLIPVFIATASSGGGGGLDAAQTRAALGLSAANLDTQLGDIPTVSEFNARTKPTADYFDHTADQVAVSAVNDKTGYSLATAPPTAAEVYAEFTSGSNEDVFKADVSGLSTFDASTDQVTVSVVNDKTGYSLATAPPTAAEVYAEFTTGNNANVFKADVSGLSTFDASSDQVVASNMRGTDNALLASSAPANFGSMSINSSGHLSRVTLVDTVTSNTDMRGTDSANTVAPDNSSISAIKAKTDQMVFTVSGQIDANSVSGGGGDDAATIYSYFTASNRADEFKSDVSGLSSDLATVDSNVDSIKAVTDQMVFTVSNQIDANAVTINTAGGSGIHTLTVTIKDTSSNLLSGARVNISGTLNTVVSNSAGLATFNVDPGTYTLVVVPPSGYQSPANVQVTISGDASQDIILTATSTGTDAGWLG